MGSSARAYTSDGIPKTSNVTIDAKNMTSYEKHDKAITNSQLSKPTMVVYTRTDHLSIIHSPALSPSSQIHHPPVHPPLKMDAALPPHPQRRDRETVQLQSQYTQQPQFNPRNLPYQWLGRSMYSMSIVVREP